MNQSSTSADPEEPFKEEAAARAVQFVQSGMRVGLGTGSTAIFATRRIAIRLGIPMLSDDLPEDLDGTIDGADEVDPEMNLIKDSGRGCGASHQTGWTGLIAELIIRFGNEFATSNDPA